MIEANLEAVSILGSAMQASIFCCGNPAMLAKLQPGDIVVTALPKTTRLGQVVLHAFGFQPKGCPVNLPTRCERLFFEQRVNGEE
jgi:hypothetical protein